MEKSVIVSDTGAIISLACINSINLLNQLFKSVYIPQAVWIELQPFIEEYPDIKIFFENKVKSIKGKNNLLQFTDYGESESIILCQEVEADYLIIDDKKGRDIAENLGITCIGALGVLKLGKKNNIIKELKPLFLKLIDKGRFYSKDILNLILQNSGEGRIK